MIKIRKSKSHLLIGSFLILIGLSVFLIPICIKKYNLRQEEIRIEYFFKNEISSKIIETNVIDSKIVENQPYIAILDIPKINLKKGLYAIDSSQNNVNKNIQILENSNMPDFEHGNFILASHSGTSRLAFFKNLYKLNENDLVYVYYKNIKYTYKIVENYNVEKDGTIEVSRIKNENMITLTTCNQKDKTKQIVVVGILINKENY